MCQITSPLVHLEVPTLVHLMDPHSVCSFLLLAFSQLSLLTLLLLKYRAANILTTMPATGMCSDSIYIANL